MTIAIDRPIQPSLDTELIAALRTGEEPAFRHLVEEHHEGLRRLARLYVPEAVVDDVVQETWIGVIKGIEGFEGRSSLKTWVFRILINQARKRGPKERRSIPFSAHGLSEDPAFIVDSTRLSHPDLGPNYWTSPPANWGADPAERATAMEMRRVVEAGIEALSPAQREVITLRDVEGWTAEEVCVTLGISAVNQRVLLHRARSKVRQALEVYFDAE